MNKLFSVGLGAVFGVIAVICYFEIENWVDCSGMNSTTEMFITDLFPLALGVGGLIFILKGGVGRGQRGQRQ